jgi:uncharacterized membrane protein
MTPLLKEIAETVAGACELVSVGFVAAGALEALGRTLAGWRSYARMALKKEIWRRFAASILLALEFALAADIARTAISPTWTDIGQLASIAAIRTFLSYFLERDVETERTLETEGSPRPPEPVGGD